MQENKTRVYSSRVSELNQGPLSQTVDVICLSHLRWDFVYQRPQHLLSRFARAGRVFFVEEPIFVNDNVAQLDIGRRGDNLFVITPRVPKGLSEAEMNLAQRSLLDELMAERAIEDYILWYYTPMALAFTHHLSPSAVIYDCMDELSAFRGAPLVMREREAQLFDRADVVFTGGHSLYEAKRDRHVNIHPIPSSIDVDHFASARAIQIDPADQLVIPHPRLGFFGVIDERMDLELLDEVARARPDWHLVMIGPVVKIDPADLPRRPNIHYLGGKSYEDLPSYIAGWDVALMPFARNEATRFISPTKTPEYLAAGKPVVSTSIRDVVRPYGEMKLVRVADSPAEFIEAIEESLKNMRDDAPWLKRVDSFLSETSWDQSWSRMCHLIDAAIRARQSALTAATTTQSKRATVSAGD
ncbi:MAG TPA: glycosyltransferase family 1 protein [Blastocatellia bacterium]|nr:glycosyltransferase family 1 protein [Blastocatellia bacterium]